MKSMWDCEACALVKSHKLPYAKSKTKEETVPGHEVLMDYVGPYKIGDKNGNNGYFGFVDTASCFGVVIPMKNKKGATQIETFKTYQSIVRSVCKTDIWTVCTNQGGEYVSKKFLVYLEKKGIRHLTTNHDSPQQNGIAEQFNKMVNDTLMLNWCMPIFHEVSGHYLPRPPYM